MPFKRPTLSEINQRLIAKVNAELEGADANLRYSPENVLAALVAMASHEMHGYVSYVSRQILVDTAESEYLERHAAIWGIYRKAATKASGDVQFTGTNGAVVPAGMIVKRQDDIEYTVDADIVIVGANGSGSITAIEVGASANAVIGTSIGLVNPISGIESEGAVVDDGSGSGLTGGTDIETDNSLRTRTLSRIQQPPHGGAAFDYIDWATSVAGVTRAWVYPNQYGLGTVGVAFVMDNKEGSIIPSAGEVSTVQDYIEERRPVTAEVSVFAPTLTAIDFEIHINPNSVAVQEAIKAELNDLFMRESEPGKTILISHIREAISTATGEYDHVLVSPVADVAMPFGEMAELGTVTWGAL